MDNYLTHHGIMGMKWGVRRYQNKDGSLTSAGKKRISRQYKKITTKAQKKLQKNETRMRIEADRKTTDRMNDGEIDKFNKQQEKKHGSKFAERQGYMDDYLDLYNKHLEKQLNVVVDEFYSNDEHVNNAKKMVAKYDMVKWDTLAKENTEAIDKVRKNVEKITGKN